MSGPSGRHANRQAQLNITLGSPPLDACSVAVIGEQRSTASKRKQAQASERASEQARQLELPDVDHRGLNIATIRSPRPDQHTTSLHLHQAVHLPLGHDESSDDTPTTTHSATRPATQVPTAKVRLPGADNRSATAPPGYDRHRPPHWKS